MQNEVNVIYKKIQNILNQLVPENWKSIYLYASMTNGEMYFYYNPKKLIKSKPINCYDISKKFNIDDESYDKELKKLYMYIQKLYSSTNERWTNITISMENNFFTIEYHYNDLNHSRYTDSERRTGWCYKYLKMPIESFSFRDRLLIEGYQEEGNIKPYIYSEKLQLENENDFQAFNNMPTINNQILK